jgi:hypothetical protein
MNFLQEEACYLFENLEFLYRSHKQIFLPVILDRYVFMADKLLDRTGTILVVVGVIP